jgi:adenosylcobinamide kinase/adenosylcobinamide-phosphate guanylyltransferase
MTAPDTTLVLGGARSGKSAFAERLVCESAASRIYLATAAAGDEEMKRRITHHRASRGDGWRTVEEPLALVETLDREDRRGNAILVDCLTLWLSNLFGAKRDVAAESARLADSLREVKAKIVLVSNEVGLGLVPETPLGRDFRDAQGRLNQMIGAAVSNVAFVAAGFPIWLKRQPL